jgi:biofilm PGA synthesis N-glycosyltransferase PgaC
VTTQAPGPGEALSYVLITPARNEEAYIGKTLASVVSQTVRPLKWVVVSDGSTDRTDEIVGKYAEAHPWIELLRVPTHRDRSFAAKVTAFNMGYDRVKGLPFDVVGNLDADISFEPDYIEFLLSRFARSGSLGVAGTPFVEESGYSSASDSFEGGKHVAGGCQLFRRACFEEIGGYVPNRAGGIDWIAVTTARMKGWETRSFKEKFFRHYRSLGTGTANSLGAVFDYGKKDYYLGGHPLWELFRVAYRATKRPYVLGGLVLLSGFLWAHVRRMPRAVGPELMRFHRREQMRKLGEIIKSFLRLRKVDKYETAS